MTEQLIPSPEDPLYTTKQVAKMFGVTEATVRTDWIKNGRIKAHKIAGRWRVQKSEVVRLANEEHG
jgi:excisionase family DNA binding protein